MSAERPPVPPPDHLWEQLGPRVREKVIVEDRTFEIYRPSDSDRLLDHPSAYDAFRADAYMPYWADLWPASRMLAKAILREKWAPGLEALEIGCGLGLPGIVALSVGLRVTFSDYDACALRFAADNARLNGLADFRTLQLDWHHPPANWQIPVILASDLIYELRNVDPLVDCITKVLAPGGLCLMTDQDRVPSHCLRETLEREGLTFTTQILRAGEPGGRRLKGTLYRITRAGE